MEKILQTFKSLYAGENKRHFYFVLLLLLPALAGAFLSCIDKDAPALIFAKLLLCAVVLGILSIIPLIFLTGFNLDFFKSRLECANGLPIINWTTFTKAVKAIPLYLVWGLYYSIFTLILFSIPVSLFIYGLSIVKEHLIVFILLVMLCALLCCAFALVSYIISPFISYIFIRFSQDCEYNAALFNPLTVISDMKKVFKETVIVLFKYILVNMVLNTVASIITSIPGMLVALYVAVLAIISSGGNIYTPLNLSILIGCSWLAVIIQVYVISMAGFAMADNLVEVYRTGIETSECNNV